MCCRSSNFGVLRNLHNTCRFVTGISHSQRSRNRHKSACCVLRAEEYVENNLFVNQKSSLNLYNDKEMTCDRIEFVIVQWKMTLVERMNTGLKFSISRVLASFI